MGTNLLPIGSVVQVKETPFKIIIVGFSTIKDEERGKLYDYIGFVYPDGFIDRKTIFLFHHDKIEKVEYMGYIDEEEREFKQELVTLLNKTEVI